MKMKLTNQLKTIDNKINANQAQYDLDREAAKISSNQEQLKNLNLNILHWVKFLRKDQKKKIRKKDF